MEFFLSTITLLLLSVILSLFLVVAVTESAEIIQVSVGESIQEAIDGAVPGDVILVQAGTYQEVANDIYGLHITTDNLTLIGQQQEQEGEEEVLRGVRLLATGTQQTGVFVGPPNCEYNDSSCALPNLLGFDIRGFSVENFPANGIQTRWVDGFNIVDCASVNNLNNGLYATLSQNGRIENSFSTGSLDSALWVAGSENVTVINNELTLAPTGLEITVSNKVYCRGNNIHDNTVGVGLYHANMAGNPPRGDMKDWVIANNTIYGNNLINTAPNGTFQAALLPGFGVFLVGVSDHVVRYNDIRNNTASGIVVAGYCTAVSLSPLPDCNTEPPITGEASANANIVSDNVLVGNGESPPSFLPPGDIVYLQLNPSPTDYPEVGDLNCFERNVDPVEFTYFSSDGELPTGGCASSNTDSPALSMPSQPPSVENTGETLMPSAESTSGSFMNVSIQTTTVLFLFAFVGHL